MEKNTRVVYAEDALEWLGNHPPQEGTSLIASMPDYSEFPNLSLLEWKEWFISAAKLILKATPDSGVAIFFQSDIKHQGAWIDKSYLCQKAAEELGYKLLWHKIFCRFPAGTITFGRPSYSHMLCFSKGVQLDLSKSTADVIPDLGEKTWERGMGLEASLMVGKFLSSQTQTKTIIHPFCGEGSMLAVANFFGLNAIGIERSPKRAQKARRLQVSQDGKSFLPLD